MDYKKLVRNERLNFLFLVVILACIYLLNLHWLLQVPAVWPDESLIAETAQSFLSKGSFGVEFYKETLPGAERFGISYPPLYFLVTAFWIKIFGFSLFSVRLLPITLGFIFLIVFLSIFRVILKTHRLKGALVKLAVAIIFMALVFDESFLKIMHMARPEALVVLLGYAATYIYLKTFSVIGRLRQNLIFVCGIFLSAAFLTHYLAIIFILAIIFHMLFVRDIRLKRFWVFLAVVFLPILFWGASDSEYLKYTLNNFTLRADYSASLQNWFWQVFSSAPSQIKFIYIMYLIVFWQLFWEVIKSKDKEGILILFLAAASWLLAYLWKTEPSYIYVTVGSYLGLFYLLIRKLKIKEPASTFQIKLYVLAAFIFLCLNLINLFSLFKTFKGENFSYYKYTDALTELIPEGANIYISAVPDPYFAFAGYNKLYKVPVLPTSKESLEGILDDSDYIIINMSQELYTAGDVVVPYIERNAEDIKHVGGQNQYQAEVVKLKPRDRRNQ